MELFLTPSAFMRRHLRRLQVDLETAGAGVYNSTESPIMIHQPSSCLHEMTTSMSVPTHNDGSIALASLMVQEYLNNEGAVFPASSFFTFS